MTLEEARDVLKMSEGDDPELIYEEAIFEFKQFLLTRVPFRKLIGSRVSKLRKLLEAYQIVAGDLQEKEIHFDPAISKGTVKEIFNDFNEKRNKLKLMITSAVSGNELIKLSSDYISLYEAYAAHWTGNCDSNEDILASVEPDPVEVYNAIVEAEAMQINNFDELVKLPEDNLLCKELKRLNLWLKLNVHGGSV